jgi:hypothetical protein
MVSGGYCLQILYVLGHGRSRGAGQKKEDDEGIQFYLLPVAEGTESAGFDSRRRRRRTARNRRAVLGGGVG